MLMQALRIHLLFTCFLAFTSSAMLLGQKSVNHAAETANYLESIRGNHALLTAFFNAMPKGGDLHHHFSGSVYGETYLDFLMTQDDWWINIETLEVVEQKPQGISATAKAWFSVSELKKTGEMTVVGKQLIRRWSVKDYDESRPKHEQFFEAFSFFGFASQPTLIKGLKLMKERAKQENVQYIETQFKSVKLMDWEFSQYQNFEQELLKAQETKDEAAAQKILKRFKAAIDQKALENSVKVFNEWLTDVHTSLAIDDKDFTMRYQTFVKRFQNPAKLFPHLLACFVAVEQNDLLVGINILAPEHEQISMRDYWLHMQFFKFFHELYPKVTYSLHAGELAMGMVKPEDLTWHISEAIYTAGAQRIGHGVDIYHENNCYQLLHHMKSNGLAVEINLSSNEFILGIEEDEHPISLYHAFQVPLVISTDDAGVLRNNLTSQFVLLAQRYPQFSYQEIKQFVYNSIQYSFIKEKKVKKRLNSDLDRLFAAFERAVVQYAVNTGK